MSAAQQKLDVGGGGGGAARKHDLQADGRDLAFVIQWIWIYNILNLPSREYAPTYNYQ